MLEETDDEALDHLLDLKKQVANFRLMLEATEAEFVRNSGRTEVAESVEAWLRTFRERLTEVEEATEEAYLVRRQLVRLLVARITVGRREDRPDVCVTYRFGEPPEDLEFVSRKRRTRFFR